jgi:hypothetical protein
LKKREDWKNKIDDYVDSVNAMVGFANFYRYDDDSGQMQDDVVVLQGWPFTVGSGNETKKVTPDLAIAMGDREPVVAEVKKSFPNDRELWMKDFAQLMKYDAALDGWPLGPSMRHDHDIVLLTHQSRCVAVTDFYKEKLEANEIAFSRPFAIVEFNRSNEGQSFFFFRRHVGNVSDADLDDRLHEGVPVPMQALVREYSMVKLWDSEPPLPYFLQMIWQDVITEKAAEKRPLATLQKRQKIEIEISVDQLVTELRDRFSFKALSPPGLTGHPEIPKRSWVLRACEALVIAEFAQWTDSSEKKILTVRFQKFDDLLDVFIEKCSELSGSDAAQLALFPNEGMSDD